MLNLNFKTFVMKRKTAVGVLCGFLVLIISAVCNEQLGTDIILEKDQFEEGDASNDEYGVDTQWWRHTTMYEIYMQSFQDSDDDGMGDLKGIANRLNYLEDLGVETIWITPFFSSPTPLNAYEITNYTTINPTFGTMTDFEALVSLVKKKGMHLLLDLVVNHCNDNHPWFQKSILRIEPYTDYFVWEDPKGYDKDGKPVRPTNWVSTVNDPMWTWNEKRRQFYLHQFSEAMPDFNLRNPKVVKEMKDIMKFWLDKGIDGFRLDAVKHFIEDKLLRNEPYSSPEAARKDKSTLQYTDLVHLYTSDQPENVEVLHELRMFMVENYDRKGGDQKIMITESISPADVLKKYYDRDNNYRVAHFPLNFQFILYPSRNITSYQMNRLISSWLHYVPKGGSTDWLISSHDAYRSSDTFGPEMVDIMNIMTYMLPGAVIVYYGQEIGMSNAPLTDIQCGGSCFDQYERTPMQWDNSTHAGFTNSNNPWLPVNPNYKEVNVATESKISDSHFNICKNMGILKRFSHTIKYGDIKTYVVSTWIYAFTRSYKRQVYVALINLGTQSEEVNIKDVITVPSAYVVVVTTPNSGYSKGTSMPLYSEHFMKITMKPKSSIVLRRWR